MRLRRLRPSEAAFAEFVRDLHGRQAEPPEEVEASVRTILAEVRSRGDAAVREYTRKFDGADLRPDQFRVTEQEIRDAQGVIGEAAGTTLEVAARRIREFHLRQRPSSWLMEEADGVLGQVARPLDRVGIYAPGGKAAYPSTVLMCGVPAQVAGVGEIVLCTPPAPDLRVNAAVLAAAALGIREIYRVGGVPAIGALAYGTETIRPVDKIVGPGNLYVATAKRLVFGRVGIDLIAGPTEVVVLADGDADPVLVAADLLAQAEHDEQAAALLVTPSAGLADAVEREVADQLAGLSRRAIAEASVRAWGAAILVRDLAEGAEVVNRLAPEHVEVLAAEAWSLLPRLRHAGAIFLGADSPEVAGDYVAGPSHVLPTGGTARFASPLSVDDFMKRSSVIALSRRQLQELSPLVEALARLEGLEAHAASIRVRTRRG